MNRIPFYFFCGIVAIFILSYNYSDNPKDDDTPAASLSASTDTAHSCMKVPSRFGINTDTASIQYRGNTSIEGMTLIHGGIFGMGGYNNQASPDEYPNHKVQVSSSYIDLNEVTNAQFKTFVDATGYKTTAEKKPDWEELKTTVPPNTPNHLIDYS